MLHLIEKYTKYLESHGNLSLRTIKSYSADIWDFYFYFNSKGIKHIKRIDKDALRDYLTCMSKGMKKSSIARRQSVIRSFYKFLLQDNLISKSPIPVSRHKGERTGFTIKLDKRIPEFLTADEIKDLIATPDVSTPQGARDCAWLELFYASGVRVSELSNINLGDINFDTREIRVLGKGFKQRIALMGIPAANALRDYIVNFRPKLLKKRKTNAVFLSRLGKQLTVREIQKLLKNYAKGLSIGKSVHPHMLRHSFATHMLDGGADMRVVQELLGHADLSSTQIYTHVTKLQAKKIYLKTHPLAQE